jgi:carboxypeptidase Taq
MKMLSAYNSLSKTYSRIHALNHLGSIASWDSSCNMPSKGAEARGNALAEISLIIHGLKSDKSIKGLIEQAESEDLSEKQRANLREIRYDWLYTNGLPEDLVEKKSLLGSKCEHAWRTQRAENDWNGFLVNFKPVVEASIEEAKLLQAQLGTETPYDALMGKYEPGQSSTTIRKLFNEMRPKLTEMIKEAVAKQSQETVIQPKGPFPIEKQKALGLEIMTLLGFDFEAGRLDVSKHPFCGGVPEDVRITTRYNEQDFMESLMGVIHETGHARYEQNLPRDWVAQPAGKARSMGVHESQSLFFEMQIGRSSEFIKLIRPLIIKHFGDDPAFEVENLIKLYTRVKADYIRVDADELTYPMHVILRFEIEEALMNGTLQPEDIPRVWNDKMMEYLGIDTTNNYKNGCMQDIHWTDGSFGYFPTYTLGAMYAAQYGHFLRTHIPNFKEMVETGNFTEIFTWLRENIWSNGSSLTTEELIVKATGETLNPTYYLDHLRARYLA